MRFINYLFFLTIISFSCQDYTSDLPENEIAKSNHDKAIDLVTQFDGRSNNLSRVGINSSLRILNVTTDSIEFDVAREVMSRSVSQKVSTVPPVEIYTVSFIKDGKEGFSIVCPDERINHVLAYVENGSIQDTAFIEASACAINQIPIYCAQVLEDYYVGENNAIPSNLSVTPDETIYGPLLQTEWKQTYPYNESFPRINCSGKTVKAYAGCIPIALAQILAFQPNDYVLNLHEYAGLAAYMPHLEDFPELTLDPIYDFIFWIAEETHCEYSCNVTATTMKETVAALTRWGYANNFERVKSSSLTPSKATASILQGWPVLCTGFANRSGTGHAWLLDGYRYFDGAVHYYCKWGIGGTCDGWYVKIYKPYYDPGTWLNPHGANYYIENDFIYFFPSK